VIGQIIGLLVVGLIIGALARLIKPGRQRMSIVATLLLGVVGAFIGGFIGGLINDSTNIFELNILGFIIAVIAAVLLIGVAEGLSSRGSRGAVRLDAAQLDRRPVLRPPAEDRASSSAGVTRSGDDRVRGRQPEPDGCRPALHDALDSRPRRSPQSPAGLHRRAVARRRDAPPDVGVRRRVRADPVRLAGPRGSGPLVAGGGRRRVPGLRHPERLTSTPCPRHSLGRGWTLHGASGR
jgi:uncharacterized membrane protein YeaQ/YmgE (transglycosylase-associated protein family)